MFAQLLFLIAQTPAPVDGKPAPSSSMPLLIGILLMVGVFYFVMMRGNKKQQKQRNSLLANLKKNDRVMTIGGIIGTVVSVRDNEVVVKVDEATNAKMTFIKKAIQQVLSEGETATLDQ